MKKYIVEIEVEEEQLKNMYQEEGWSIDEMVAVELAWGQCLNILSIKEIE